MKKRTILFLIYLIGIKLASSTVPLVYHIYSENLNNDFGNSLALNGSTLFVGAPFDEMETNLYQSGLVYVYTQKGATPAWTMTEKLVPEDAKEFQNFGVSLSISKNYSIIGAPSDDVSGKSSSGSAYIFTKLFSGDWIQQTKLYAVDGSANSHFGFSVSIVGNVVAVGAPGDPRGGAVYIFYRDPENGWYQDTILYTNISGDDFGYSVCLSADGNRLIVGAPSAGKIGSAYIFTQVNRTWYESATLVPLDVFTESGFGYSVSIYRNTAIVGAPFLVGSGTVGSAYIFEYNNGVWVETAIFPANDKNELGSVVTLADDETAFVSAPVASEIGSVNMYTLNGSVWQWVDTFITAKPYTGDNFGRSVVVEDDLMVVGANRINNVIPELVFYSGFFSCPATSQVLPSCQNVPSNWNCSDIYYHDYSTCNCGCNIEDPDCVENQCPAAGWSCDPSQWGDGLCHCNCTVTDPDCQRIDNHTFPCTTPPSAWTCQTSFWGDGLCDCNCGTYDPDCSVERNGCPPHNWTCGFTEFNDLNCHCQCGAVDPSCPVDECPPASWSCSFSKWSNGKCDCGCGVSDIDCSSPNNTIDCSSYISNESHQALVDSVIVFVVILLVLLSILGVLFYRRWQRNRREKYYFKPEMSGESGKFRSEDFTFGSAASDTASTTEEGKTSESAPPPPPRDYPRRPEYDDQSEEDVIHPPSDEPPPTSYPLFPPTGDTMTTNLL